MSLTGEIHSTPEKAPEVLFPRWIQDYPVSEEPLRIDTEEGIELGEAQDEHLAAIFGEPLRVVAGIRAGGKGENSTFLLCDSRDSQRIQSPFLLLQDDDVTNGYKGVWPNEQTVVGRRYHTDRFTYDGNASRSHFAVFYDSDKDILTLQDLASTNGTYLTGFILEDKPTDESSSRIDLRHIKDIYTYLGEKDLSSHPDASEKDAEAPYGYYKGHPFIGRNSTTVRNGIYSSVGSEFLLVDDKSRAVRNAVASTMDRLDSFDRTPTLDTRGVLRAIESQTAKLLKYDLEATEKLSEPHYANRGIIELSEYLNRGIGVCRHQAILAALSIEAAIDKGFLEGGVSVQRNIDTQVDGGHAWAVFHSAGQDDLIVDPTNHFVGTRKDAEAQGGWFYVVSEDGKDQSGRLYVVSDKEE